MVRIGNLDVFIAVHGMYSDTVAAIDIWAMIHTATTLAGINMAKVRQGADGNNSTATIHASLKQMYTAII